MIVVGVFDVPLECTFSFIDLKVYRLTLINTVKVLSCTLIVIEKADKLVLLSRQELLLSGHSCPFIPGILVELYTLQKLCQKKENLKKSIKLMC